MQGMSPEFAPAAKHTTVFCFGSTPPSPSPADGRQQRVAGPYYICHRRIQCTNAGRSFGCSGARGRGSKEEGSASDTAEVSAERVVACSRPMSAAASRSADQWKCRTVGPIADYPHQVLTRRTWTSVDPPAPFPSTPGQREAKMSRKNKNGNPGGAIKSPSVRTVVPLTH